jgi:uncharacterized short protein YbdD (DUF466 family)
VSLSGLGPSAAGPTGLRSELRRLLAAAARITRAILGVPDYEAYLAHARAAHPDGTPQSRDEFFRERLEDRQTRPGSRCC